MMKLENATAEDIARVIVKLSMYCVVIMSYLAYFLLSDKNHFRQLLIVFDEDKYGVLCTRTNRITLVCLKSWFFKHLTVLEVYGSERRCYLKRTYFKHLLYGTFFVS